MITIHIYIFITHLSEVASEGVTEIFFVPVSINTEVEQLSACISFFALYKNRKNAFPYLFSLQVPSE